MPGLAELLRGEIDFVPANADSAPSRVDLDAVHVNRPIRRGGRFGGQRRRRNLGSAWATQQGTDARHHLAHAERLGEVVISAALQSQYLVALFAPRRQHQHRDILVGPAPANRADDGDAVHAGEHQVEDDQVVRRRAQPIQGLAPIRDGRGLQALETEVERNQIPDVSVVFDDERVRHG